MTYQNSVGTWRLLSKPKFGGLLHHVGFLRPDGLVVHNSPVHGEHVSTAEEFGAGEVIIDCGAIPARYVPTLQRSLALRPNPKPYDVFNNNCEHFITKSLGGPARSPQLGKFAAAILAAFMLSLVLR